MAGDWIKVRVNLHEDLSVISISEELGMDPFAVVGRLCRIWSWADQNMNSCHAPSVTPALLDRMVSFPGFAKAMENAGWLSSKKGGIEIPNFDRHLGKRAKIRSLATKRQESKRDAKLSRKSHAGSVTSSNLESLDKDSSSSPSGLGGAGGKPKRSTRVPDGFDLTAERRQFAVDTGVADVAGEWEQFLDCEFKPPGNSDWPAAWRRWCRTAVKIQNRNGGARTGSSGNRTAAEKTMDAVRRVGAEIAAEEAAKEVHNGTH